jgi:hypothetical protein
LDVAALARASRLVAKVDSAALQDGYALYLHGFIVTDDGKWVVVQQGMNDAHRRARRYHWLSEGLTSFVEQPHSAIEGRREGTILNLTDRRAAPSCSAQLQLLQTDGPDRIAAELARLEGRAQPAASQLTLPHLVMPGHHDVRPSDVNQRRLQGALAAAADCGPKDFAELLLVPGVGARTVAALALVAEVIHGTPCRFTDPARFSLAHGGKDGHPFPVPILVYDETIRVLKRAMQQAKLGHDEQLQAIRRLDEQARRLESLGSGPTLEAHLVAERAASARYGGQSMLGKETRAPASRRSHRARPLARPTAPGPGAAPAS